MFGCVVSCVRCVIFFMSCVSCIVCYVVCRVVFRVLFICKSNHCFVLFFRGRCLMVSFVYRVFYYRNIFRWAREPVASLFRAVTVFHTSSFHSWLHLFCTRLTTIVQFQHGSAPPPSTVRLFFFLFSASRLDTTRFPARCASPLKQLLWGVANGARGGGGGT